MLTAVDLTCVRGQRTLFSGLSFEARAGELFWVTGANGSGKTSLLRMLCTLLRPEAGELRWNASPIGTLGEAYFADAPGQERHWEREILPKRFDPAWFSTPLGPPRNKLEALGRALDAPWDRK